MLNPSFVSDNCIKLNKILNRNNSFYFAIYNSFNNRFANGMEWRVLIVGIHKDVGINQIYGQGIHCKAFLYQMPVLLYDRDERLVSLKVVSFLFFAIACSSSSNIQQILLSPQFFQEIGSLKYLLFFSGSQPLLAWFQSFVYTIHLKISRKDKFSQYISPLGRGIETVLNLFQGEEKGGAACIKIVLF